jgi:hypothetical protein
MMSDLELSIPQQEIEQRPASDAASLMAVITRIAENPEIDLARIEKMLDMYERVSDRQAKADFASALATMQEHLPEIDEHGKIIVNNKTQSTYAKLEDINIAIKPVLAEYGFAISFRVNMEANEVLVTGILSHRGGHKEETTMRLPIDTSGNKNAVQARGSSVKYGQRYVTLALLNITSRNDPDDDDGVMAGAMFITEAQVNALNILADAVKADKRAFCGFMNVESIAQIPARDYKKAEEALRAKGRKATQS